MYRWRVHAAMKKSRLAMISPPVAKTRGSGGQVLENPSPKARAGGCQSGGEMNRRMIFNTNQLRHQNSFR
jgi:hypothetical protein